MPSATGACWHAALLRACAHATCKVPRALALLQVMHVQVMLLHLHVLLLHMLRAFTYPPAHTQGKVPHLTVHTA